MTETADYSWDRPMVVASLFLKNQTISKAKIVATVPLQNFNDSNFFLLNDKQVSSRKVPYNSI